MLLLQMAGHFIFYFSFLSPYFSGSQSNLTFTYTNSTKVPENVGSRLSPTDCPFKKKVVLLLVVHWKN
jgi:hypothetical protein